MLMIALSAGTQAHAVDFADLVEAWAVQIDGQRGSDGDDEASGVEVTIGGDVLVAGWLDGVTDHGHDGYAVSYAPSGVVSWEFHQDAGVVDADRTSSEDRLYDLAIEPVTGDIALCGGRGPADLADPEVRFLVEAYDAPLVGAAPVLRWDLEYVDGNVATSRVQECRGVDWRGGQVVPAGWAEHGADEGRWYTTRMDELTGFIGAAPLTYEYTQFEAVPDQALDVATSAVSGVIAVAGTRGFSGLPGSLLNDADWHVRYYDAAGVLSWSDTYGGTTFLEDRANAVALDALTGDIFVVGWTNKGQDNGPLQDLDWLVVRYNGNGDGFGNPLIVWTQTFESAPGASEGATSVWYDDTDQSVVVGGWSIDPGTGLERWRVSKLAYYDGAELQEWLGPVHGGDSRVADIDGNDGKVAIAGYVTDGAGRDFAALMLEGDTDGDGAGDSVDFCINDPAKWIDGGVCGCDVPDIDTDSDGTFNCLDECESDPEKTIDDADEPGGCGCDVANTDTDGDLTPDCDDRCPENPDKIFDDTAEGGCGCNAANTDTDDDGVLGCHDACADTDPGVEVDAFGCPSVDTDGDGIPDSVDDDDDGDGIPDSEDGDPLGGADTTTTDDGGKGGCGCGVTGAPAATSWVLLLGLFAAGRRRRL